MPPQTSAAGCLVFSGLAIAVRTRAMIATGMLTQKIVRQLISTR
jgi:hypothetical protein